MSKVSLHAINQFYKNNSEDPVLLLLTLNFPDSTTYHLVNNTQDIVSNGITYTAFPFMFNLPDDDTDSQPELNITLSNIGLDFVTDFRSATQDVTAKIEVIFSEFPDLAEITIDNLEVKNMSGDVNNITIAMGYQDILSTTIPSYTYSPKDFPGVFNV